LDSREDYIADYLKVMRSCLDEIAAQNVEEIVDIITKAWQDNRCVFIMGNGGSATTAAHFARDLSIGTAMAGKRRLRVVSLADNIATVTALANDLGYHLIFKEQLVGCLEKGDVVIGISVSGNSPNVLEGIEYAGSRGAVTVGLIGFGGGKLKELVNKSIVLSSRDYGPVEDTHLVLDHIISALVKERIASG
jgi:D-sedoheptulose 7-phosphate isomerase